MREALTEGIRGALSTVTLSTAENQVQIHKWRCGVLLLIRCMTMALLLLLGLTVVDCSDAGDFEGPRSGREEEEECYRE